MKVESSNDIAEEKGEMVEYRKERFLGNDVKKRDR